MHATDGVAQAGEWNSAATGGSPRAAWLARRLAELTQQERDVLRAAAPLLDRITRGA